MINAMKHLSDLPGGKSTTIKCPVHNQPTYDAFLNGGNVCPVCRTYICIRCHRSYPYNDTLVCTSCYQQVTQDLEIILFAAQQKLRELQVSRMYQENSD
jgi:hypothetical protein